MRCSFSSDRAKIATRAPRCASISAVTRPIPDEAPVTIATFPSNSLIIAVSLPHASHHREENHQMDPELNNVMQAVLRWAHVVAGILWIGHLYFFNFVNGHV